MQRVEDLLRASAGRGGSIAECGTASAGFSFAELDDLSERLAGVLQAQGITNSDRVAVFMDEGLAAFAAIFATLKAGAAFSPVDPSASAEHLTAVLNDSCAACLFVEARLAPAAAAAMAEAPLLRLIVVSGAEGSPAIDGLLRFEDAITADMRPLASPGTGLDAAMLFYPPHPGGLGECAVVTHGAMLDAARASSISAPCGTGLIPPLLTAIAGMAPDRAAAA